MKRYLKTISIFLLIASSVITICFLINASAPRIQNGESIPTDIDKIQYVVSNFSYQAEEGGYHLFFLNAPKNESLAVTLYFKLAEVSQFGQKTDVLTADTAFARTYTIYLKPDENGMVDLLLRTPPSTITGGALGYSWKTLFTRYTAQRPKVVIGTAENAVHASSVGNNFYRILIGLYLMLIIGCLIMFRRKHTEKYLLTVCTGAAFVLLYLMTALNQGLFIFPYQLASRLGTITNIISVVCLAFTCIGLFPECVPSRCRKVFSIPVFIVITASAVLLDLAAGIYMYQFMRRLVLLPVLITMTNALAQQRSGSRMIFSAYSIMEGIALFLYLNNSVMNLEYSPLLMFLRVKEISNLIFVSACAFQIFDRFSSKYLEADRLAEEVSILNISLEQKVKDRTRSLLEEQERKHQMMTNVFHDLRSPIFVLKGHLEAMNPQTTEDKASVAVMRTRVEYLEKLAEDLFLSAKLESGDILYDQDIVSLTMLYNTILRDMSAAANEYGITLNGENVETEIITWGDSFRLQQAIVNITENALLYTPKGGKVTLSLQKVENQCLFSVQDTGKGILPEDLPKIFDRYFCSDRGNKRSSGLGLSIARDIITAHHGFINVNSQMGAGSTFLITLPYCSQSEEGGA